MTDIQSQALNKLRRLKVGALFMELIHPCHYRMTINGISCEAMDIIRTVLQEYQGESAFYMGYVLKYLIRAAHKGKTDDLKKAYNYLDRLINAESKGEETGCS